jgi:hypothetical protein
MPLQFVQWVTVQPGGAYALSVWVRATVPAPLGGVPVTLALRMVDTPYTSYGSATAVAGAEWSQLSVPLAQLPPGAPASAGFFLSAGSKGTVWFDDASLTLVPASSALPVWTLGPTPAVPMDRSFWCMNANHMCAWGA